MERVKVGVIGLGWVAQVVHLPILSKMLEVELVAVCDRDKARARLVAEKYGLKSIYTDVGRMLEQVDCQAVVICTSTDTHKDVAVAALETGRDVLVEKPIARKYTEAVEIAETAKHTKRKLMVGMNHRFRPDTMILKSFLQGKELGKVFYTKAGWLRTKSTDSAWLTQRDKSGGGAFIDLGIVLLDMALWLMDFPEVKKVSAVNFTHKTKEVEDTSLVTITTKGGASISLEVSWSMNVPDDVYYCQLFGTEGSAGINPLRINKELHGNLVNLAPARMDPPQHMYKRSYENELRHFIGAVTKVHPVISTADEAVQRMRIVEAVYKSARTSREVTLSS